MPPTAYAGGVDLMPHGRGDGAPGVCRFDDLVDHADLHGLVDATGDELVLCGELGLDLWPDLGETSASLRRWRTRMAATDPITATSAPGQAKTLVAPRDRAFIAM